MNSPLKTESRITEKQTSSAVKKAQQTIALIYSSYPKMVKIPRNVRETKGLLAASLKIKSKKNMPIKDVSTQNGIESTKATNVSQDFVLQTKTSM